jgi:AAA family ATP:ADP antiporter
VLYVFIGSVVYFEQKNILSAYSRAERVQILGSIDWIVNSLTFGCSFLLSGRLLKRLGTGFSLALVPFALVIALVVLAIAPVAIVLIGLQIVRRVGNYALTRPARETLFTKVSAEDRFKAKPVIDVVVYRGGDAVTGTIFAFLTEGIGLTLAAVSLLGAGVAGVWGLVGFRLGNKHDSPDTLTQYPIKQQDLKT